MIDVSEYQGHIDWAEVYRHTVRIAAVKAGEGLYEVDSCYHYNFLAANRHKITVCPYFFGHPSFDPRAQARHFLSIIGTSALKRNHGRPGLDLEVIEGCSDSELQAWAKKFCRIVDDIARTKILVYTYSAFAPKLGKSLVEHPLWIANYNGTYVVPTDQIGAWNPKMVFAHQFTDKGTCPGINGPVDRSARFVHRRKFEMRRLWK